MTIGKARDGSMTLHLTPEEAKAFDHPYRKAIVKETGSANGEFRITLKMTKIGPPPAWVNWSNEAVQAAARRK